jgi:chromosome segregation ATPase
MGKPLHWLIVFAVVSAAPCATADPAPARPPAARAAPDARSDAAEKTRELMEAIQDKVALVRVLESQVVDLIRSKPVPPDLANRSSEEKQKLLAAFEKRYDEWLASVAALQMALLDAYHEIAALLGSLDEATQKLERARSDDAEAQRHQLEAERERLVSARNKISSVTTKLTAAKSRRQRAPAR